LKYQFHKSEIQLLLVKTFIYDILDINNRIATSNNVQCSLVKM